MTVSILSCIVFSIYFWWNVAAQEPCFLNLNGDRSPLFRPFLFTDDGELYPAQNDIIKLTSGKSTLFSCENNYFRSYSNESNLTVKCEDDGLYIKNNESPVTFKELSCDLRIVEEVKHNVLDCQPNFSGISYQYFDTITGRYNHLAEVCYDNKQLRNIFTHIVVSKPTSFLEYSQHDDNKLQSNSDIHHRIAMLSTYRADKIKMALDNLLGEDFVLSDETLVAMKLPPRLFFNDQLQDVQKFPANYVPVFSSVMNGNWRRLLNDIKYYSQKETHTLDVYFGTHEVLKLSKINYLDATINLDGAKSPVPKYLWTVVHEKKSQSSVAIFIVNNPFLSLTELNEEVLCNSVCNQIKWLSELLKHKNYERSFYGYAFCCSLDSLPYLASVKSVTKRLLT